MIAVITGASRGIGKAVALQFAKAGYEMIVTSKSKEKLAKTVDEIKTLYPEVLIHSFNADLTVKKEVEAFAFFSRKIGVPSILINNAGVYIPGNCMDNSKESMEFMMNVNFYSAYYLTIDLLPDMIKNKQGHIFNICSVASLKAYDGGGSYSISKFALHGFSMNLRHELKNKGIKVTSVFPGATFTDTWGDFNNSDKRIMEADDIAKMIFSSTQLSSQAVVEEILIRPQLGDL